jgi:aminopeptidase-like protein
MIERLMNIDRSITGDGVRRSLEILKEKADFNIHEIPSGTKVFDWTVPQEWVIRDAILSDETGKVWADYKKDFLHVVSYSEPVNKDLKVDELSLHLHTSNLAHGIPYRTSYYKKDWGFCVDGDTYKAMDTDLIYHAEIDSEFKDGSMTYGEKVIEGDEQEYIISTYCCHPNMINDNVAGMAMWADLLKSMGKTKHTYRFIIAPETIGMISYLATHDVSNVKGAMVLSHVAGRTAEVVNFKQSFQGNSYMDRIARQATGETGTPFTIRGSDERQLSSPAFRIPTIILNKGGLYGPYYHTSLDRVFFPSDYQKTLESAKRMIELIESDRVVESLNPKCEPMLSKRQLYPTLGGNNQTDTSSENLLTVMFNSGLSLLDISEKTGISMTDLIKASDELDRQGLIKSNKPNGMTEREYKQMLDSDYQE